MIRVLFICHGNICRSPMAEFVLKDMLEKRGLSSKVYVASSATSSEEIGNPVHYGTRNKLAQYGISVKGKTAVQFKRADYDEFDYIIVMDSYNMKNLLRIIGEDTAGKVSLLLDFTDRKGENIADPWYTGNFDLTYDDIYEGCNGLIEYLFKKF